jgi:hypothetical protein
MARKVQGREKQRKQRYAKGGRTKMPASSKVKTNSRNCRGMGCATHGGKFGKDG